jgi:gluconokinase
MIVMLMGVVGAGKTTIGELLAAQLGWEFADADDFHSAANIEKIRQGIPLEDADRAPWIVAIHEAMLQWDKEQRNVALACSALKRSYREQLSVGVDLKIVYLRGSRELIYQRLLARHGHFATEQLLSSQLATLEEPDSGIVVNVDQPPLKIVADIRQQLRLA